MSDTPGNQNDRDLLRIVRLASAVSMGAVAGFLCSVKQVHPSLRFAFSMASVAGFVVAAAFAWVCVGIIFRAAGLAERGNGAGWRRQPVVRWLIVFGVVSAVATLGGFAYAMKDVAGEELRNVMEGTAMAVVALGIVGWMLRRVVRFFEVESERAKDDRE